MIGLALAERRLLPDFLIRYGIRRLCQERLVEEHADTPKLWQTRHKRRIEELKNSPIAIETDAANEQHYEVPSAFYTYALGKHRKYSGCWFENAVTSLDEAEAASLSQVCERAEIADGQKILELGCGWGSLTLWIAEHFPDAHITGVSNSASQKAYIDEQARQRGLTNIEIVTANVVHFEGIGEVDRVVSIEMFEHMRNYRELLSRIHDWLKPGGKLFVHVFCHKNVLYPFEDQGESDWMARYFFTGGLMPSYDTLPEFQRHLKLEERWFVSGTHYQKTSNAWLENMDHHESEIMPIFDDVYGEDAAMWFQRWRIFFMACAELFGYRKGTEWHIGHYRFVKA